ncbi:MAG: PAS domain-containing protein [Verrucomicrobia bacterium]|nr:PAS domain-containing protein [Verrucomicrobiota bacterium]
MAHPKISPTGRERTFGDDELIVSKTDLRGAITYANDVFCRVSGYAEAELLGQPHNLIRHPDMPACVFQVLWDTLHAGQEIFAYVVNQARNGDHYWVFAHVTCSRDPAGNVVGYHSNRRVPYADALPKVQALYAELRAIERSHPDRRAGMQAARAVLDERLQRLGISYSQFVFSLSEHTRLGAAA